MIINAESNHRPKWWRSMKSLPKLPLLLMMAATGIALSWSIQFVLLGGLRIYNAFLSQLQSWTPREITIYSQVPWQYVWLVCIYLWLLAPLLLEAILKFYYPLKSFNLADLSAQFPESLTLWQKFSSQHSIIRPKLKLLLSDLPIALSYGSTPRTGVVLISTGLLNLLSDEELAPILGSELGKIVNISCFWFSGAVALLQLPYCLYWQVSRWADKHKFPYPLALFAALSWCIYKLWRLPLLWLSRMRTYYSDRYAVELTGNPNAYSEALLKIAQGITQETIHLGYVHPLLESFDLTLPLDPQQALSLPFERGKALEADCTHISRFSRSLLVTHPPLGERLYILAKCAEFWRVPSWFTLPERSSFNLLRAYRHLPLLPKAIITAFIGGLILRCLFWLVGFISLQNGFQPLVWMAQYDLWRYWLGWLIILFLLLMIWFIKKRFPNVFIWVVLLKLGWDNLNQYNFTFLSWLFIQDPILLPWLLVVLGFVLIIKLNQYFPSTHSEKVTLNQILEKPSEHKITLVVLEGKLLGRKGVSNWLAQDLRLETETGVIKLKYSTSFSLLGNLLSFFPRPCQFTGAKVIVRGWLHHSLYPWIDVDTISLPNGGLLKSNYRMWLLILAFASVIWSAYQIYKL